MSNRSRHSRFIVFLLLWISSNRAIAEGKKHICPQIAEISSASTLRDQKGMPPLELSKKALLGVLSKFFKINSDRNPFFRTLFEDTLSHSTMLQPLYDKDGALKKNVNIQKFESLNSYNEAFYRHPQKFKGDVIAIVDNSYGRSIILSGSPLGRKLAFTQRGDWIYLQSEYHWQIQQENLLAPPKYPSDLRDQNLVALQFNQTGKIIFEKTKSQYFLDSYPGDTVVLTRTLSIEEKKIWDAEGESGEKIGSLQLQSDLELPYRPTSFATAGYWSDFIHHWQTHIQLEISKKQLREMIKRGDAYLTPLGMGYFINTPNHRLLVDASIELPFEVVAITAEGNSILQKAYHSTKNRPSLVKYREAADLRVLMNGPLSIYYYYLYDLVTNLRKEASEEQRLRVLVENLKSMRDGQEKISQMEAFGDFIEGLLMKYRPKDTRALNHLAEIKIKIRELKASGHTYFYSLF